MSLEDKERKYKDMGVFGRYKPLLGEITEEDLLGMETEFMLDDE